jgi:hypothetical protein
VVVVHAPGMPANKQKWSQRAATGHPETWASARAEKIEGMGTTPQLMHYVLLHLRGGSVACHPLMKMGSGDQMSRALKTSTILASWCGLHKTSHSTRYETDTRSAAGLWAAAGSGERSGAMMPLLQQRT